jgi:glycosyltransferase involved in cell wall biosynthesis
MLLDVGNRVTLVDSHNPKPEGAERYEFISYPGMFGLEQLGLRTINRLGHRIKAAQLKSIWKRTKPDVVHVHWVDQRAYQCALAGVHPLVLTCWGSDINNLFDPDYQDTEHRNRVVKSLFCADHITADSSEVLRRCDELTKGRVSSSVFRFGVDLKKFKPGYSEEALGQRQNLGIAPGTKVILSVRALRPLMGHHHILEAFRRISSDPALSDSVLVFKRYLPFADGYEESLKRRINELNLERRVRWLDEVSNDEMPIDYAMADVVLNYPERDGFPVTLFESAACKRPVITSYLPAYKDTFGEDDVWVVSVNDISGLASTLKAFFTLDAKAVEVKVLRAYDIVREHGDQEKCLRVMENVYQSLAAGSDLERAHGLANQGAAAQ